MKGSNKSVIGSWLGAIVLALPVYGETYTTEMPADPVNIVVGARGADSRLVYSKSDFVAVPIPMSDPTLGSGLVLASAYFYAQTEAQKKSQPASLTGAAGIYTNNDSFAYGIFQQNYWGGDKWRFKGVAGHMDFKFALLDPLNDNGTIDWLIKGNILQAGISRRIGGDWYLGLQARYVANTQSFEIDLDNLDFDVKSDLTSVGAGITLEFDTRDVPTNPYTGVRFEFKALVNGEIVGSDDRYQTYELRYQSYHRLLDRLVLAWEVAGCKKAGSIPLWDACRVALRGFAATDFLGRASLLGQAEARWRFWKNLGAVGFAGYGFSQTDYSDAGGNVSIPSYGVGLRYMVLESKRINLRLDFARSRDSDAVYLSVSEAF